MLVIWFPSRSPAQIVFAICAGMTLLINNGDIPVISNFLVIEEPLPFVSSSQPSQPTPSQPTPTPTPAPIPLSRDKYANLIHAVLQEEHATHIDSDFVFALVDSESNWNPEAVSKKGAVGLTQLMPATARQYGVTDRTDPRQSITGGIRYLKKHYAKYSGDYRLMAAAYNAGEGAIRKHNGIPPYRETEIYVNRVLGKMAGFKTLRGDWSMRRPLCRHLHCLYMKSAEAVQGGKSNHGIYAFAAWVQNNVGGFIYGSGFNDLYHQDKYNCSDNPNTTVMHCHGLAVDFTVVKGTDIQATLLDIKNFMSPFEGFSVKAISKCNGCTAPHFHAEFDANGNANHFLKYAIDNGIWIKQGVSAI